jgi:hypothetical protein
LPTPIDGDGDLALDDVPHLLVLMLMLVQRLRIAAML